MTVNEMIISALTTESRKRKARYQSELEELGYKVYKDRGWTIRNPINNRWVEIRYNQSTVYTNNREIRFGHMWSYNSRKYIEKPISVIDFEGLLNKRAISCSFYERNTYEEMSHALWERKYHQEKLDNAWGDFQNKMDSLMKQMELAKKSYEENIKHNTYYVNMANAKIDKLLKKN